MTENRKAPKLRFKGFTDAWEQRKLGDVGTTYTGLSGKAKEDFGHGNGKFITYMNVFSNSVASSEMTEPVEIDDRQNKVISGDVLFTTSSETPEEVGMSSVWLEKSENTYLNSFCFGYRPSIVFEPYYLAYMFRSSSVRKKITFLAQGISRYNISKNKMMNIEIFVPTISEQQQVGEYFRKLDHLITLHQRKLDRLKNIKKSMLDKMFPKDGEVVPEIRFKGFTDAWEQRKLSEVLSSYTDPVEIPRTGYERLGIRSHAKGTFHNFVPAGHELQTAQMHRVAADKFIVNITFGWEHAVAVTDENDAGKLVSHRFPQFSLSEELDPKFLKFIILDEDFRHHLWLASPGGAGRNRVLNINEMLQYEIMIPNVPEQRKIARLLIDLDNLITLHQRKSQYYIRRIRKECLMI